MHDNAQAHTEAIVLDYLFEVSPTILRFRRYGMANNTGFIPGLIHIRTYGKNTKKTRCDVFQFFYEKCILVF